jgi:hypothetical protein
MGRLGFSAARGAMIVALGLLLGLTLLGGCGWTDRDEFLQQRQVVIHARAGDGAKVSLGDDSREVTVRRSASVPGDGD